jgi:hypothetical protein
MRRAAGRFSCIVSCVCLFKVGARSPFYGMGAKAARQILGWRAEGEDKMNERCDSALQRGNWDSRQLWAGLARNDSMNQNRSRTRQVG